MNEHQRRSGHGHAHHHDTKGARLLLTVLMNFVITAAQIAGGIVSGSLSLISDAMHNFSDSISIIVSYLAVKISARRSDLKRTFGYKRASILAALSNAIILVILSFFLFQEAWSRFMNPRPIEGITVIWVALIGLIANVAGMLLLRENAKGDINIRSSYIHLLSDTLSSVGVVVGGLLILFFEIYWIDPLLTVLIALYVLRESYEIFRRSVRILMQGVPEGMDVEKIAGEIKTLDGVMNVHHVHLWSLDERNIHFEAHVGICDMPVSQTNPLREEIERMLSREGINHVTIQFEHMYCDSEDIIGED